MRETDDISAIAHGGSGVMDHRVIPPSVILLDDDPDIAEMYRLGLEARGFRVTLASGPAALFEVLAHEVPDVLILDWLLPGTSGGDVLELVRSDPRLTQVPVFMLSNHLGDRNGAVDRVFALGALAWLRKPHTPPDVLAQRLMQAIARKHFGRRIDDHD
jgi:two-component system, OmpR family, phosphate regulon response regulator PhoB